MRYITKTATPMDISEVIESIEQLDKLEDRCIAYSEVILYLRSLEKMLGFTRSNLHWKDTINEEIDKYVKDEIANKIEELKGMVRLNVSVKNM